MKNRKTPLDYIKGREQLVPVQVRLPRGLAAQVKAKLKKEKLTFTQLVRGACSWYLEATHEESAARIRRKTTAPAKE